jgi:hypothetical protein
VLKLLLVVLLFAALTSALIRVIERRGVSRPTIPRRPRPPQQRQVAPDDDEEFLRDLDQRRRHPEHPEDPEST